MNKLQALMLGFFVLLVGYLTIEFLTINAFGEEYKFNMTKELNEEGRVLQICIETDIYLPFCDTRLGSIDKTYGGPIN